MRDFTMVRRLPTSLAAGVGRVMARWNYEEWLLGELVTELLGADRRGKLAVRGLRAEERVALIEDLMRVRKLAARGDLADLRASLRWAKRERDLLAHGMWLRRPGTRKLHILETRRMRRGARPRAVRKTARDLSATYREIDRLVGVTKRLERELRRALKARARAHGKET